MDVFDYPELQPKLPLDTSSPARFSDTLDIGRIADHTSHWHLLHPSERERHLSHVLGLLRQAHLFRDVSAVWLSTTTDEFCSRADAAAANYQVFGKAQRDKLDAKCRAEKMAQRELARRSEAQAKALRGRPLSTMAELGWPARLRAAVTMLDQIVGDEAAGTAKSDDVKALYRELNSFAGCLKFRADSMAKREALNADDDMKAENERLKAELAALKGEGRANG